MILYPGRAHIFLALHVHFSRVVPGLSARHMCNAIRCQHIPCHRAPVMTLAVKNIGYKVKVKVKVKSACEVSIHDKWVFDKRMASWGTELHITRQMPFDKRMSLRRPGQHMLLLRFDCTGIECRTHDTCACCCAAAAAAGDVVIDTRARPEMTAS